MIGSAGGVGNYDLFRLNSTGTTVLAAGSNVQNGTQDPYEEISAGGAGNRLVIVKFFGSVRFLHLGTLRGRLSTATAGEIHGHAAVNAPNAFGVAATPAVGPLPNAFSAANVVETFSSNGPRRIFYTNNGTPIPPGNVSTTGGQVLNKPDITAADGTTVTGAGGFPSPFFGTSAAAPHAAAIAALIKSANPALTAGQIRTALISSAIDIDAPNKSTGQNIVWLMNGTAVGVAAFALTIADANVELVGVGDLNGDTRAAFRNKVHGENTGWLMNGTTVTHSAALPTVADTNWENKGVPRLRRRRESRHLPAQPVDRAERRVIHERPDGQLVDVLPHDRGHELGDRRPRSARLDALFLPS